MAEKPGNLSVRTIAQPWDAAGRPWRPTGPALDVSTALQDGYSEISFQPASVSLVAPAVWSLCAGIGFLVQLSGLNSMISQFMERGCSQGAASDQTCLWLHVGGT